MCSSGIMEELGLKNQEGRRKRYYLIDFRVLCDLIKPLEKNPVPSKTLAHWRANDDDHVVGLNFSGNGILLLRMKCCRSGSLTFYVTISRGGSVVSSFGSSKSCDEKCVPVSFSIWWAGLLMRSGACRKTRPTTTQLTAAIFCAITCRIEPTEKRRASTSFFFFCFCGNFDGCTLNDTRKFHK